jgi:hypothetical protein
VSLAALEACYRYNTVDLKRWRPVLEQPARAEAMDAVLDAYLLKDDTPRVRERVELLKAAFGRGLRTRGEICRTPTDGLSAS